MKNDTNFHKMNTYNKCNYLTSGLILSGIAILIYFILLINGKSLPYIALAAGLLAVLSLYEALPLRITIEILLSYGNIVHKLSNPLIFGLIFVVAVIPTALILKLFGKDILKLRYNGTATSYWHDRTSDRTWKASFYKQY